MPRYHPEPAAGAPRCVGILLVNLGTPAAPTAAALRPYLAQFLADPRVVELPRLVWLPILHGIILRTRPAKSAQKYAAIWLQEGSPLAVHTQRQAKLLKDSLAQAGHTGVIVDYAMRYGQPAIAAQLAAMKTAGCDRILVLPLYPQYAGSTTGSVADALAAWIHACRAVPALRLAGSFAEDATYIEVLVASIREHWRKNGRAERLVMSFHGVPRRTSEQGDPYERECRATAQKLAAALGLDAQDYLLCFQSRFGKAEWLGPATQASLVELAKSGTESVDLVCPGFVSDCLETLEEIAIECRNDFLGNGGKRFAYIPCLNENPDWIACLQGIVERQAGDWLAALAPRTDRAAVPDTAKEAST